MKHLLSGGLLRCGLCGARMSSRPRGDGALRYVCRPDEGVEGCGHVGILGGPLETHVRDVVFAALDGDGLARARHAAAEGKADHTAALATLEAGEERLDELASMYGNGDITRNEYLKAREVITDKLDQAQRTLSRSESSILSDLKPGKAALMDWWEAQGDNDGRRILLAAVLETVEIGEAVRGRNFFDPDRVTFRWRF